MDATLMSICAETQGRFEMDAESSEPMETCVYAKLMQLGHASQSLDSAGEKDGLSTNYLPRLAHHGKDSVRDIGEMHRECLKLVSIVQKCKLGISATTANNAISKDVENAHNTSYIRKKSAISNGNGRASHTASQAKRAALEKNRVPSGKKFFRMASLGEGS